MEHEEEHRPNLLVIAPWHDEGSFRARVTRTDPRTPTGKSSVVVKSKASTLRLVEEWLTGIEPDLELPH